LNNYLGNPTSLTGVQRALVALKRAVTEFEEHYRSFAKDHCQYIRIEDGIHSAIQNAALEEDIAQSANIFADQIRATLLVTEMKEDIRKSTKGWNRTLCKFLSRLYPVARFSLRLTGAFAEVAILIVSVGFNHQGAAFMPLKGLADGLGIILQVSNIQKSLLIGSYWMMSLIVQMNSIAI
jgi:hypothetical protein